MRARWYDPHTGQFITKDPIGLASGETNLYHYAAGDPMNLVDPTGTSVLDWIASLDNPVSQAVAGALNSALSNGPAKLFGFDPACVSEAFDIGSTYLSLAVPLPSGKIAAVEKLAAKAAPEIKAGVAGGETAGKAFPQSVRQAALDENPSTCVFCRMETDSPQVDHAIPRARGGDATIENAQTSCPHCNASKGARDNPVNPPPGYRGPWPPPWWRP